MFKKFTGEDVAGQTQAKSSVQRSIKAKIVSEYPALEGGIIDELLPKKAPMFIVKWYVGKVVHWPG